MGRSKAEIEVDVPCLVGQAYSVTSPKAIAYNCFAWAEGETLGWLDPTRSPGNYWPDGVPRARTLPAYSQAYARHGFEVCADGMPEEGFEKIAIYVDEYDEPSHAARLLAAGAWSSKLGELEDIDHQDLGVLAGPDPGYGDVRCFMKRRRDR